MYVRLAFLLVIVWVKDLKGQSILFIHINALITMPYM